VGARSKRLRRMPGIWDVIADSGLRKRLRVGIPSPWSHAFLSGTPTYVPLPAIADFDRRLFRPGRFQRSDLGQCAKCLGALDRRQSHVR
jgi:hypothetical protein